MRKAALLIALALSSCASPRLGEVPTATGPAALTVVSGNSLPNPTRADLSANSRPYLIGPFDKLTIDVYGIEDLSAREIQADASGRILFPLIGTVDAAGKTPGELAQAIAAALRGHYVRDPQVTVNLKETVSQVITVDGEVKEPGLYPVIGQMSLMRAVATAKGTGEFARLDDVVIFRTVNGQRMAALYNIKAIRTGQTPDPEVFANDVVIVGKSRARQIFKDVLTVAPSLTYPVIAIFQRR